MVKDTGYEKRMAAHNFRSPSGKVYENIRDLTQFCREHNLIVSEMRDLISGRKKSYRGWVLWDGI